MTGFGIGSAPLGEGRVVAEVRSLNHRYLEVRVRTPPELLEHGFFIEQLCRQRLTRGRYEVTLRLDSASPVGLGLDVERARAAYRALCSLRDEIAPGQEVPVAVLAHLPQLFVTSEATPVAALREMLSAACTEAILQLEAMREREGESLEAELRQRLGLVREVTARLSARAPEILNDSRRRLQERVQRLLRDSEVTADPQRLEVEVALLADRTDVAEELARLRSHFEQFDTLLTQGDNIGRPLDFLLQEITREANTVGSKSQDAELARWIVELKSEVERLREQVQNVE